ncbi:MAG TPA: replicative DNA helicase [Verrucomicrobiae bacterium]|nr:replicative DNA helicase [Verrucomicrobiae bacterium]
MTEPISRRAASARVQNLPKQPPHSIEAEQSVLGGLMLNNRVWNELADKLVPEDFYRSDHQLIYRGICDLIGTGKACDFVTLSEHLRNQARLDEAGGAAYLGSLAADTYSIANVVSYGEIVRERSVLRGLIAAGADIGDLGYRPDGRAPPELIDEAEQKVFAIRERGAKGKSSYESVGTVMQRVEKRIELLRKDPKALAGLSTGFAELDKRTQGLHPGDLVIIAARPAMGKTTLAMNIAEHVALVDNKPVAVFSMEMSGEQLALRVLSSFGRIELGKLRSGHLSDADFDRLSSAQSFLHKAPLYIDETGALSPMDIRARARRLAAQYGIKLIVIDYLQLMQVPNTRENRTNEVSMITRSLKALAKELSIPIIALSQLSRANEKENRKPKLSDLRDSGGIEQDADLVLFIYREDVTTEVAEARTKAEIIIGKQRSGPTGSFALTFLGQFTKFDNPADQSFSG